MFGIENFNAPIVDFHNFNIAQLGNALLYGGAMLLMGIAAVFAVLCILWLFLILFKLVFHDLPKKRKPKNVVVAPIVVNEPVKTENNDDELIAVISAAIAMAESDNSGMKFRVVSFKRS